MRHEGALTLREGRLGDEAILLQGPLALRSGLRGKGYGHQLIEGSLQRETGDL